MHHNGIEYQINNFRFNVKNDSFYQINEEIMVLIYQQIFDWIESSNLNIVDAFSGVGTIGSYIANKANKVYSIEINQIATMLAKSNILKNKLKNLEVINDDANDWIVKNAKKIDLVIFDPPREGLKKQSIEALIQSKIKKIIYLSCDPKTLVRDLKELINNNYLIKEVIPYDMFPQTHHIETLVLLEKK
ncbi:class I SAM-dependent RNA methyltransferase [Metamycoplasma alkalescens]|uniref:class I SAM-dependent RNA methyltransferase n=1 Tax=Metamycoplasma alkalescens TaxID=45363 RepID=UPI001EE64289|nr:methyltransferase [Metamycoplasma alkalescens]